METNLKTKLLVDVPVIREELELNFEQVKNLMFYSKTFTVLL